MIILINVVTWRAAFTDLRHWDLWYLANLCNQVKVGLQEKYVMIETEFETEIEWGKGVYTTSCMQPAALSGAH